MITFARIGRTLPAIFVFWLAACSHPQTVSVSVRSTPEKSGRISPPDDSPDVLAARSKLGIFDYRKSDMVSFRRQSTRRSAGIVTEDVTMVINDPLRRIGKLERKFLYYRHPSSTTRPTVIVFTLFGEDVRVDKLAARYFCRKGFNALIPIPNEYLDDKNRPFKQVNEVLIRQIIVARMGIDMLEQFPETDPQRLFAYGMSMGGIRSALLFGIEPRIKRAGVIAGGGDVAGMISDTDYDTLRETGEARMAAENIPDRAALREYLDKVITAEPLDFACLKAPEDIMLVISSNDDYVRNEFQEKLFNSFSRPREGRFPDVIYSGTGHYSTCARFYLWAHRFAGFFHAY